MSVAVLSAFLTQSRSELAARLVGIVLADSAWTDGITWISQEEIARKAKIDERTVRRAIASLIELGEVDVRKANRGRIRVNVYRVRLGANVPQYERLPFVVDDPFSDDRAESPAVDDRTSDPARPDIYDRDDRTSAPSTPSYERKRTVSERSPAHAGAAAEIVDLRERSAQDVVAAVVDAFAEHDVPIPSRHRGMLGRQAAELLQSGFDWEAVALACVTAVRRGEPQNAHFIAADLAIARSGQRITRREYERALQDEMELAGAGGRRGAA